MGIIMKIHHLRHFDAVAKCGSLRAAARLLGLAQPALTRSLRELEEELDIALVERCANGVTLTEAGIRFSLRARSMLEDLQKARDEMFQLRGEMQGKVTIGCSPVVLTTLLPLAYKAFRRKYPQVRLSILETVFPSAIRALQDASMDFYIGPEPQTPPGSRFRIDVLWDRERLVIARKGHPLSAATSLAQLCNAEWLAFGLRSRAEDEFDEVFLANDLPSPPLLTQVNSMLGLIGLLTSTDALAFLPKALLMSELLRDRLQAIPVAEHLQGPKIIHICRSGVPLTPAAEKLSIEIAKAARYTERLFD